jgi:hypothetical protein
MSFELSADTTDTPPASRARFYVSVSELVPLPRHAVEVAGLVSGIANKYWHVLYNSALWNRKDLGHRISYSLETTILVSRRNDRSDTSNIRIYKSSRPSHVPEH